MRKRKKCKIADFSPFSRPDVRVLSRSESSLRSLLCLFFPTARTAIILKPSPWLRYRRLRGDTTNWMSCCTTYPTPGTPEGPGPTTGPRVRSPPGVIPPASCSRSTDITLNRKSCPRDRRPSPRPWCCKPTARTRSTRSIRRWNRWWPRKRRSWRSESNIDSHWAEIGIVTAAEGRRGKNMSVSVYQLQCITMISSDENISQRQLPMRRFTRNIPENVTRRASTCWSAPRIESRITTWAVECPLTCRWIWRCRNCPWTTCTFISTSPESAPPKISPDTGAVNTSTIRSRSRWKNLRRRRDPNRRRDVRIRFARLVPGQFRAVVSRPWWGSSIRSTSCAPTAWRFSTRARSKKEKINRTAKNVTIDCSDKRCSHLMIIFFNAWCRFFGA